MLKGEVKIGPAPDPEGADAAPEALAVAARKTETPPPTRPADAATAATAPALEKKHERAAKCASAGLDPWPGLGLLGPGPWDVEACVLGSDIGAIKGASCWTNNRPRTDVPSAARW